MIYLRKGRGLQLKSFSVKNIKSFRDEAEIELKPITIFVGKNRSGKSSLVRFPVVLAQSFLSEADTPIMFFGKNIDYGNYEDVIFGHKGKKMQFSVTYDYLDDKFFWRTVKKNKYYKTLEKDIEVKLNVEITKYSRRIIVDNCNIYINGELGLKIERIQNEKYRFCINALRQSKEKAEVSFPIKHLKFYKYIPFFSAYSLYEDLVNYYSSTDETQMNKSEYSSLKKKIFKDEYEVFGEEIQEKDNDLSREERKIKDICTILDFYSVLLENMRYLCIQDANDLYYIGPFRENPNRVYRDAEHQVGTVGTRGENVSVMLKNDYNHGKKMLSGISDWLYKAMGYRLGLKDIGSGLYNIVVIKEDGTEDNLIDVGYGISQVLPIVTQIVKLKLGGRKDRYVFSYNDRMNSIFIIEQPELHLHPGAQAELANLFVEAINSPNCNQKILIETHSEHLLRRLQALIADKSTNITSEQVKIYYVDKNKNNEAYVTEMKICENGQFESEWPSGFFDKAHELSMELLRNNLNGKV